jgi:3'-5' exoribonuclease
MQNTTPNSATAGAGPFKKLLFIKDLKPRDVVRTSFLVKSKELLTNKQGKPYLALMLADKTGEIDSRVWDNAEQLAATFNEGDIVAVGAKAHLFQDRMQLMVEDLVPLPPEEVAVDEYLPKMDIDLEGLYAELIARFERIENKWVKALALSLLNDPEIAQRYKLCPAAKTIHHAYIGGLLVHSLQLVKLVDAVHAYYSALDINLLLFGAAFHDFGKIFELSYNRQFGYTDEGKLVGHIAIGVVLIDRKICAIPDFPKELEWHLKHLVLSHHGKLEYGSPKIPATLEAELVHWLDHMDSRLESIQGLIRADKNPGKWTAQHRAYGQYYWKG